MRERESIGFGSEADMAMIATLTMNPTIDAAYAVPRVRHTHKVRTHGEHYDPGGGGINVARVVSRLGGMTRAIYLAGGATGTALDGLVDSHEIARTRIPIKAHSRISVSIFEEESGKEYRFVPPGPMVAEEEWQACLSHLAGISCDYIVMSGSLPQGVPGDFYARAGAVLTARGALVVLDSSGEGLRQGLEAGGVHLVKPSLGELRALVGAPLEGIDAIGAAALDIVRQGKAAHVVVSMGHEGALLAFAERIVHLPAVPVEARSAVGAGDSFVAAMTFAMAHGVDAVQAFRYGIAAGAAAVLTPGTDLCHKADVDRLHREVAAA